MIPFLLRKFFKLALRCDLSAMWEGVLAGIEKLRDRRKIIR